MNREDKQAIERSFAWLIGPLKAARRRLEKPDTQRPATWIAKLKAGATKALDTESPDVAVQKFKDLLRTLGHPRNRREMEQAFLKSRRAIPRRYLKDQRFVALVEQMRRADSVVPFAFSIIVSKMDFVDFYRRLIEPIDAMKEARQRKGEVRARAVVRAARDVAEMLYEPYLRSIWHLLGIQRGRFTRPPSLGNLVRDLTHRIDKQSGLIESDAALFRNAAAHAHWRYLPESDSVELWDRRVAPAAFKVDVLRKRVEQMYEVSGGIAYIAYADAIMTGFIGKPEVVKLLLDLLAEAASDDQRRLEAAEAVFESQMLEKFQPAAELFRRSGWVKRQKQIGPESNSSGLRNEVSTHAQHEGV